ncbi:SDR family oxidoreductase [Flavobacterium sp. GT2N3]|uniref:SDR family oxidoreductase n=1 Tax=unclassified Flavobacterium TaxID=196869 RepID=UPI003AADF5B7
MQTVLITGANKGIGFETAKQMAALGYFIYVGSRDTLKGKEAVSKLQALGFSNVEAIVIDVTNLDSIIHAKEELESKITCLDVLINNAGISSIDTPQTASLIDVGAIQKLLETNFYGAVQTTQQFLSLLKKSEQPRIVNVSSDLGSLTFQSDPNWMFAQIKPLGYIASKVALNAFTITLAYELKDTKFKINSVNPGATATDLNNHMGKRTPEFSAQIIVKCATLKEDEPSGKFFSEEGLLPW